MHNILIDSEFQALIPPLSAEERAQLEANLLADGCRDPLVVWETSDGQNILIDGHNRHEICTRLGSSYEVEWMQFDDRSAVIEWIIKNQFGRRNLSDYQRGVLALRMKPIMEDRARAQQLSTLVQNAAVSQISDERKPIRTDAKTAGQDDWKPALDAWVPVDDQDAWKKADDALVAARRAT